MGDSNNDKGYANESPDESQASHETNQATPNGSTVERIPEGSRVLSPKRQSWADIQDFSEGSSQGIKQDDSQVNSGGSSEGQHVRSMSASGTRGADSDIDDGSEQIDPND